MYVTVNGAKLNMGHIVHLRNQFKSINPSEQSYDYIITLIMIGKKSPF